MGEGFNVESVAIEHHGAERIVLEGAIEERHDNLDEAACAEGGAGGATFETSAWGVLLEADAEEGLVDEAAAGAVVRLGSEGVALGRVRYVGWTWVCSDVASALASAGWSWCQSGACSCFLRVCLAVRVDEVF